MSSAVRRAAVVAAVVLAVTVPAAVASAAQAPAVSWSQSTYGYGTLNMGGTGSATFILKNLGGSATSALTVTLTGSAAFSIPSGGDGCTGTSLGPGKSCTVTVGYAPASAGQQDTGTLTATAKKITATALTLTGASKEATPPITISPGTSLGVDNGINTYGYDKGPSSTLTQFTVENTGTAATDPISLSNNTENFFGIVDDITDSCYGAVLQPGGSCDFYLTIQPGLTSYCAAGGTTLAVGAVAVTDKSTGTNLAVLDMTVDCSL